MTNKRRLVTNIPLTRSLRVKSVLLIMQGLNKLSELFFNRQMRMLAEAGVLRAIVVEGRTEISEWQGIPVYSLTDTNPVRRVMRAGLRRLGLPGSSPSRSQMLRRALSRYRPDVILCQYGTLATRLAPVLESTSSEVYVHVHGFDTHEQMCPPGYKEQLVALSERTKIICNSQETRRRLLKWGIADSRLYVKHMGVEVPAEPLQREARNTVTILHLGRLVDCKSPDRTIQAFEIACEQGLDGKLIIAGDGPLRTMCELMRVRSKWKDRIKILGAVTPEEGAELRRTADIFTQHSITGELTGQVEAFGVTIVEAMAAGLPVVSCRIGGIVETAVDGVTGFLVEPGDVEAQASAMLELACNPPLREQMGKAGWQRVRDHFSYHLEKQRLLSILEEG